MHEGSPKPVERRHRLHAIAHAGQLRPLVRRHPVRWPGHEGALSLRATRSCASGSSSTTCRRSSTTSVSARGGAQVAWVVGGAIDTPVGTAPAEAPPASVRPRPLRVGEPEEAAPPSRRPGPSSVRPPGVEGLNPKYTFANFVVGPSNQLAHAAAIGAAGGGGRRHNPLFLCGGTGLGKTHLVHAVAHRIREDRPDARIVYISAERFVNEFVQALQDQKMVDFRARYRERCDSCSSTTSSSSPRRRRRRRSSSTRSTRSTRRTSRSSSRATSTRSSSSAWRSGSCRASSGASSPTSRAPSSRRGSPSCARRRSSRCLDLDDAVVVFIAQQVRSNVREPGHAHPARRQGVAARAPHRHGLAREELASTTTTRALEAGVDDIQRVVCHH